jgi:PAS domain S-box-containing protein
METISSNEAGNQAEAATSIKLLQGVAQSKEGFALCDAAGCYTYMNAEHLHMFGYECLNEVLGRPWTILYREEEQVWIQENVFPEIVKTGSWNGQLMAKRRDGSLFHEDLTLSRLPDGGIACNCRDRSLLVELNQKLVQSEQLFREFADNLPECVVIRDARGHCSYLNRMAAEFNGGMLRSALGRRLEEVLSPDLLPVFCGQDAALMRSRSPSRYEAECLLAGTPATLEVVVLPVFDGDEHARHIGVVWSDVTIRRVHERETAAALARNRELLRMRGEFISLVSHEFRTPLSAIQSSHFLIKKTLGDTATPKLARYLALQEESIDNLRDLVNQVLELNRAESAQPGKELKPVKPLQILVELIDRYNDSVDVPRVQRRLDLPEDLEVVLDERLFRAAVENLVTNALKYSPVDSAVEVEAGLKGDQLVVTVKDSGRGIPPLEQDRLFEPFFRASNVGNLSGTGLGLAIVRRAAEVHGGKVAFESTQDFGSVFRLQFPVPGRPPLCAVGVDVPLAKPA